MGHYTQFHFTAEIHADTAESVLTTLDYLCTKAPFKLLRNVPQARFFSCPRWDIIATGAYSNFTDLTRSSFFFDHNYGFYNLLIHSEFKNYNNEIREFLHWMHPFTYHKGFSGYYVEEGAEPVFLFNEQKGFKYRIATGEC